MHYYSVFLLLCQFYFMSISHKFSLFNTSLFFFSVGVSSPDFSHLTLSQSCEKHSHVQSKFHFSLFRVFFFLPSSQPLFSLTVSLRSALQSLHKACDVARCHNYYPGSLFLTWVSYYQSRISSNQFCINEWNAMQDVESHRANSPVLFTDV